MSKKKFTCEAPDATFPKDIGSCNNKTIKRTFMSKVKKTLDDHQREIEDIIKAKGGRIIGKEWRREGNRNRAYFKIECGKGHTWWASKINLKPKPSQPKGTWCPHPDCRGMSLDDHQRDIENIVRAKGGRIIGKEWRLVGKRKKFNAPFFHIECDKGHTWWALKSSLVPTPNKPEGSWCPIFKNRISAIGRFGHIPIEYFSLILFNLKHCKVVHENTLEEGTRPDLVIDRDDNFKFNIEKHQNVVLFSDNIEIIAVDFTFGLTGNNILYKCFRNYQTRNRYLLIVLLREGKIATAHYFQRLINNDVNINSENKKRIKVINFEAYLDFLNLGYWNFDKTEKEKKIESNLRGIVTLCKKSIDKDSALATLSRKSEKYIKLLSLMGS